MITEQHQTRIERAIAQPRQDPRDAMPATLTPLVPELSAIEMSAIKALEEWLSNKIKQEYECTVDGCVAATNSNYCDEHRLTCVSCGEEWSAADLIDAKCEDCRRKKCNE